MLWHIVETKLHILLPMRRRLFPCAEKPVPDGDEKAEIMSRFGVEARMVDAVHIRRDNGQPQHPVGFAEVPIGMGK